MGRLKDGSDLTEGSEGKEGSEGSETFEYGPSHLLSIDDHNSIVDTQEQQHLYNLVTPIQIFNF